MASIHREVLIEVSPDTLWDALKDVGGRLIHHNASAQVFAEGPSRSRLVWIADLLPDELAPTIAGMIDEGTAAMKRTMEAGSPSAAAGLA